MFIPTRIVHIYERRPIATFTLVILNTVIFLYWLIAGSNDAGGYGLDPGRLRPVQFVTAMFLHVDVWHLAGNMLFLWVYGIYVEDRLGPLKMLAAYLMFGLCGDVGYLATSPERPAVGASGAIAGLMGFCLVAAPWTDVRTLFFIDLRQFADARTKLTWNMPIWWMLGYWLVVQALIGLGGHTNIGVSAHIGGFAAGAALAAFLRSSKCKGTSWYLEPAPGTGGPALIRRLRKARGGKHPTRAEPTEPHAVTLSALDSEASPVAIMKLLMKHCFLSPETAKEHVDALQASEEQSFGFDDAKSADAFRVEAAKLGAT